MSEADLVEGLQAGVDVSAPYVRDDHVHRGLDIAGGAQDLGRGYGPPRSVAQAKWRCY